MNLEYVGITKKYLTASLAYSSLVTLVGIAVLVGYGLFNGFRFPEVSLVWLLFYVVISSPVQELFFRGLLQTFLVKKITPAIGIIIASMLYGIIHYPRPILIVFTFGIGLLWGYVFYKRPNILGPIISHIILGTIALNFLMV